MPAMLNSDEKDTRGGGEVGNKSGSAKPRQVVLSLSQQPLSPIFEVDAGVSNTTERD